MVTHGGTEMTREMAIEQWNRQLLQRDRALTVEEAVDEAGGIYSTAPTSYLSFVARVPGFVKDDLERALYRDRTLVRMSALRGSGFLIPLNMIDMVSAGSDRKDPFRGWAQKLVGPVQLANWQDRILAVLDGAVLPARSIRKKLDVAAAESESFRFLLSSMTVQRQLASASGPTGWRDSQYGYAIWEQWFPDHRSTEIGPEQARAHLAEWYLKGHGPGTVDHFAWWGGLKKANARQGLEDAAGPSADGLYDLGHGHPPDDPRGLRLLPVWDTALVAPKGRRRMVRTAHQPFVYDASGNVTSTVVLDGAVIGVWSRAGDDDHIVIRAAGFGPLDAAVRGLIADEAELIRIALGASDLTIEFVTGPVNLQTASRNRFLSSLAGS